MYAIYGVVLGVNVGILENGPLEDHFPLQTGGFPLPC